MWTKPTYIDKWEYTELTKVEIQELIAKVWAESANYQDKFHHNLLLEFQSQMEEESPDISPQTFIGRACSPGSLR
jgi:hypothetical protein